MNKFVEFFVEGIVYKRDKNGRPAGVEQIVHGNGVTLNDPGLMGSIFRQCPDLFPCDRVAISTAPLG